MTLRDLLVNRIAPLRQYCDRTIEMYGQTLDRLRDFLGHEPTLDDLDDLDRFEVDSLASHHAARPQAAGESRERCQGFGTLPHDVDVVCEKAAQKERRHRGRVSRLPAASRP
jgi:hypothetical protein